MERVSDWMIEWVRCQFDCNIRSVIQQIFFHVTQSRIHWNCSVSVLMSLHFAQMQCGLFIGWPDLDITSCLDLYKVSVVILNWASDWLNFIERQLTVKYTSKIKWCFDIAIYLSVDMTFLTTTMSQFLSFPHTNSSVKILISAQ